MELVQYPETGHAPTKQPAKLEPAEPARRSGSPAAAGSGSCQRGGRQSGRAPQNPVPPGVYLGHDAGDSRGQQRYRAASRALAVISANAWEQRRPRAHTVHGMQEVRDSLLSAPPCPSSTFPHQQPLPNQVAGPRLGQHIDSIHVGWPSDASRRPPRLFWLFGPRLEAHAPFPLTDDQLGEAL